MMGFTVARSRINEIDAIADPAALTPDHYVDPSVGTDDPSHGLAARTGAWKTLAYAWTNAPSGAIVQPTAAPTNKSTNGASVAK